MVRIHKANDSTHFNNCASVQLVCNISNVFRISCVLHPSTKVVADFFRQKLNNDALIQSAHFWWKNKMYTSGYLLCNMYSLFATKFALRWKYWKCHINYHWRDCLFLRLHVVSGLQYIIPCMEVGETSFYSRFTPLTGAKPMGNMQLNKFKLIW